MKKINAVGRNFDKSAGLTAKTGFHCPTNGFWRPEDRSINPIFIFEGSIMPAGSRGSTVWYLEGAVTGPPAATRPNL